MQEGGGGSDELAIAAAYSGWKKALVSGLPPAPMSCRTLIVLDANRTDVDWGAR